jgi:hypothetical protein
MVSIWLGGLEKGQWQRSQKNILLHHHQPLQEKGHEILVQWCITGMEQVSHYEHIRTILTYCREMFQKKKTYKTHSASLLALYEQSQQ